MAETAGDLMTRNPRTVAPTATLLDLDRALLEARVSAFPVVDGDDLVGIVSRSDVVRHLAVEQSLAEVATDHDSEGFGTLESGGPPSLTIIADRLGHRIEKLRVRDFMVHKIVTVTEDQPLEEVARVLVERRIHRVPVLDASGGLVGIVSALDFVALRARTSGSDGA